MLLRLQKTRERARKLDAAQAARALTAAAAVRSRASDAAKAHEAHRAAALREHHEALRGRTVDLRALDELTAHESALMAQSVRLGQALDAAETLVTQAATAYSAARRALEAEIRATQKRERLSAKTATAWRHLLDEREEGERDEAAQMAQAAARASGIFGMASQPL